MLRIALLLLSAVVLGTSGRSLSIDRPLNQPDIDTISQYIKMVLENLKADMPNGIPQLGIPPLDPLKVDVIDVPRIQEGIADIKIGFKDFNMRGLSSFEVVEAKGDLTNMGVELELTMAYLGGNTHYDLDGKVLFFPLFGSGNALVQVNELKIKCRAAVGIKDMEKVQLTDFFADLSFGQLQIYLENIIGGGNIGDFVNTLLNMLGKYVYDRVKGLILPEVNRIILSAINNELSKVKLQDIIGGILPLNGQPLPANTAAGNAYVDRLMAELRPVIISNNLDPMALPTLVASFSKKILLVTVRGSARITNGALSGLSTIHRSGDCHFNVDAQARVTVSCEVGVNNIYGRYSAQAEFMGIGVGATANIAVGSVRVALQVSGSMGGSPNLDRFNIVHMSAVGVRISGLGPLDWALSPIATVIVNAVKAEIIKAIEAPIRNELRNVLGRVVIPSP